MPAFALTNEPETLLRYEVIGERPEHFVKHVGLLDEDSRSIAAGDSVSAVHMAPPLKRESMIFHVTAHVPLTSVEVKQLSSWIEENLDELKVIKRRNQYIIDPPWKNITDSNTGILRYRRFSCAGFVLWSHSQVGIELIDLNPRSLPEINRETIAAAYVLNPQLSLEDWGLSGEGPWRIVLPGYILNALNRSTDEIRRNAYQVQPGDEFF